MNGTWTRTKTVVVTAIIGGGVVLGLLASPDQPGERDPKYVCDQFRAMAADVSDGVLTDAEIRQAAQTAADRAIGTEVADEARRLLAAATTGTVEEFVGAMGDMQSAC